MQKGELENLIIKAGGVETKLKDTEATGSCESTLISWSLRMLVL